MKVAISLSLHEARLQRQMKRAGMESESSYDHGRRYEYYFLFFLTFRIVLTSDYAVLLAEEFGRNPVVDDEAAFDIHPPYVALSS